MEIVHRFFSVAVFNWLWVTSGQRVQKNAPQTYTPISDVNDGVTAVCTTGGFLIAGRSSERSIWELAVEPLDIFGMTRGKLQHFRLGLHSLPALACDPQGRTCAATHAGLFANPGYPPVWGIYYHEMRDTKNLISIRASTHIRTSKTAPAAACNATGCAVAFLHATSTVWDGVHIRTFFNGTESADEYVGATSPPSEQDQPPALAMSGAQVLLLHCDANRTQVRQLVAHSTNFSLLLTLDDACVRPALACHANRSLCLGVWSKKAIDGWQTIASLFDPISRVVRHLVNYNPLSSEKPLFQAVFSRSLAWLFSNSTRLFGHAWNLDGELVWQDSAIDNEYPVGKGVPFAAAACNESVFLVWNPNTRQSVGRLLLELAPGLPVNVSATQQFTAEGNVPIALTANPFGNVAISVNQGGDYIAGGLTSDGKSRVGLLKRKRASISVNRLSIACQIDICFSYIEASSPWDLYRLSMTDRNTSFELRVPAQRLPTPTTVERRPKSACSSHRCVTVYQRFPAQQLPRSYVFMTEHANGTVISPPQTIVGPDSVPAGYSNDRVSTEFARIGDDFMLIFVGLMNGLTVIQSARLRAGEGSFDAPIPVSDSTPLERARPALACYEQQCVVFWREKAEVWEIKGRFLNPDPSYIFTIGPATETTFLKAELTKDLAFLFSDGLTLDARWFDLNGKLAGSLLDFNTFSARTSWSSVVNANKILFFWQYTQAINYRVFTVVQPLTSAPTPLPTPFKNSSFRSSTPVTNSTDTNAPSTVRQRTVTVIDSSEEISSSTPMTEIIIGIAIVILCVLGAVLKIRHVRSRGTKQDDVQVDEIDPPSPRYSSISAVPQPASYQQLELRSDGKDHYEALEPLNLQHDKYTSAREQQNNDDFPKY